MASILLALAVGSEIYDDFEYIVEDIWEVSHRVEFDLGGGQVDGNADAKVAYFEHFYWLSSWHEDVPSPIRNGFGHVGWRCVDTGSVWDLDGFQTSIEEERSFEAIWVPLIPITFELSGGHFRNDFGDIVVYVPRGERVSGFDIPLATRRDGLELAGWINRDTGDELMVFEPGHLVFLEPTTFVARWSGIVRVTFDNNGELSYVDIPGGTSLENMPDVVREGYNLVGWLNSETGEKLGHWDVPQILIIQDTTFTAIWEPPMPIVFDLNGGNMNGCKKDVVLAVVAGEWLYYDASIMPQPTREGYWLSGWRDTVTGNILPLRHMWGWFTHDRARTVVAEWSPGVKVTFDLNGGTIQDVEDEYVMYVPQGHLLGNGAWHPLPHAPGEPVREGYKFIGWHHQTIRDLFFFSSGKLIYSPMVFVAKWEIDMSVPAWNETISIVFDLNGGALGESTEPITLYKAPGDWLYSGIWDSVSGDYPIHPDGYPFVAWQCEDDLTLIYPKWSLIESVSGNRTFVALWGEDGSMMEIEEATTNEIVAWNITFDLNGGSVDGSQRSITVPIPFGEVVGTVPVPGRQMHVFVGWKEAEDGPILASKAVEAIEAQSDKTFVAVWVRDHLPINLPVLGQARK